jgi:ABC-2 type transport system ATP-binding protein
MNQKSIIEVNNLNKSFGGKPTVINLNLAVKEGEICGFLGPNGSGKTTTLRMLCGLLTPDSGRGHCLGYNILTQSYEIKSLTGYMTQNFSFYHELTAYENLDFVARVYQLKQRHKKIDHCLKTFDLAQYRNQLAGHLSGGFKQRLALAACLLHEPKLLLLDEPTAGVDPKSRREFWDELHKLSNQGITTLVSTHYMDEAERCTRLAYIAFGHLMVEGTITEIIGQAKLTVWSAHGENLFELSNQLKILPGIEQVSFFGNQLHVSGTDETLLNDSIIPFREQYTWEKINPSLEDVFISLVKRKK